MGGLAGGLFGGGDETQTTTSTTVVNLPDWIQGPIRDIIGRTQDLSQKPYSPFEGERLAGFTPDELRAFEMTRQLTGQAPANLDRSRQITGEVARRGLEGFSQAELQPYMNPYVENVLDIARRRQFENFDRAMGDYRARGAQAAAFGGSRFGLGEAQMSQDFQRQLSEFDQNALYNAYNEGIGRAMQGTQLAGQSSMDLANLANLQQQAGLQGVAALEGIGGKQRGLGQAGLDIGYQDFLTEQAYPYQQLQFASSLYNPVGSLMRGSTQTQVQETEGGGPGFLGTALGLASMAMGIPGVGAGLGSMLGGGSFLGGLAMGGTGLQSAISGFNAAPQVYNPTFGSMGANASYFPGSNQTVLWNNNRGGLVSATKENHYNNGGLVGRVDDFMSNMFGGIEPLPDAQVNPRVPIEEEAPMYPTGPTRGEWLDVWEKINSGELPPPSPDDSLLMRRPSSSSLDKGRIDLDDPRIQRLIEAARESNVPPEIAVGVFGAETSFGKNIKPSKKGAIGPMQTMPDTLKDPGYGVTPAKDNSYDELQRVGLEYLGAMLEKYGNTTDALVAYNWGPSNATQWIENGRDFEELPSETQNYVEKVQRYSNQFETGGVVNSLFGRSKAMGNYLQQIPYFEPRPGDPAIGRLGMGGLNAVVSGMHGLGNVLAPEKMVKGLAGTLAQPLYSPSESIAPGVENTVVSPAHMRALYDAQEQLLASKGLAPKAKETVEKHLTEVTKRTGVKPAATETKQKPSPTKKEGTPSGQQSEPKEGLNLPLIAFGAQLLGSKNNFFKALGEGAKAYATTSAAVEQQQREREREDAKLQLERLRTDLYGKQVQASLDKANDPYTRQIESLKMAKLVKELSGEDDMMKATQNLAKTMMENDPRLDPTAALQEAKRALMTLSVVENSGQQQQNNDPLGLR